MNEEIERILLQAEGREPAPVSDSEELDRRIAPFVDRKGSVAVGAYNHEKGTVSIVLQRSFKMDVADSQFRVLESVVFDWLSRLTSPQKAQEIRSFYHHGDSFRARLEDLIKENRE